MDLELKGLFSGLSKKKLEKKVAQYKNQLTSDPYNPKLCLQLGDLLTKLGQPQAAIEYYYTAANLLVQRNNPSKVGTYLIEIYKKILSLAPDDRACENLGAEYSRIGKHTKAYDLYLSVAETLYQQGVYEKALKLYQSALVLVSNSAVAHLRCADIYYQLGQFEKSALEYIKLAELSLKRGKSSEAVDYYAKALELTPSNFALRARIAEAYQRLGKKEGALAEYLNLANGYLEKGEASTALKYYKRCLAINPNLLEASQGKMKAEELCGRSLEVEGEEMPQAISFQDLTSPSQAPHQDPELASSINSKQTVNEVMKEQALKDEGLEYHFVQAIPFSIDEENVKPNESSYSGVGDSQVEESYKTRALIQEKELLEEKLKEQLKAQELLRDKMEKILESKRRLQLEFQDQLSRIEEERQNLASKVQHLRESEVNSIGDLKSLQDRVRILEEKLSQTGQEKEKIQEQLSRQIAELKDKEKNLKAELTQIIQEKWDLEEKLEALMISHQELQDAKRISETQFKQTVAELQTSQAQLQEQLAALLKEKVATHQQLKLQVERLNAARKLLKQKLEQVSKLKHQLEQRLKTKDSWAQVQEELRVKITKLEEEKYQLQGQLKAVTSSKAELEAELLTLKNELDDLQQTRNESSDKIKELTKKYVQLGKVLKHLSRERKNLIQQLSAEVTEKNRIKQALDQIKQDEQQLQKEIWEKLELEKEGRQAAENALEAERARYQAEETHLRKELSDQRKKEAELEARITELLARDQEVDVLRNQLKERLNNEEELNQKLNSIQAQYERTLSQMLEEKAQLEERIQQLQVETDQIKKLNSQQLAQVKAELEEKAQKEKLLVKKLKQWVNAKALASKSLSEDARKKLALYEKKISNLQTELEEARTKNQQIRTEIQTLESSYKKELSFKQREIEELKRVLEELLQSKEQLIKDIQKLTEEKDGHVADLMQNLSESSLQWEAREQELQSELQKSFQQKLQQVKTLYLKKIIVYQRREAQLKEKLKESRAAPSNGMDSWLKKRLEDIQASYGQLETLLKETRAFNEAKDLQLKKGLAKVIVEIDKLEKNLKERITSLEDRNTKTETWLKEVLHPQSLRALLNQEPNPDVSHSDKSSLSRPLKGSQSGRAIVLVVLVVLSVLFLLRHVSHNEEMVLHLDHSEMITLRPEDSTTELFLTTSSRQLQTLPTTPLQDLAGDKKISEVGPLDHPPTLPYMPKLDNKAKTIGEGGPEEPETYPPPPKKKKGKSIQSTGRKKVKLSSRSFDSAQDKQTQDAARKMVVIPVNHQVPWPVVYPTNLLHRWNQTPQRLLWYNPWEGFYNYRWYDRGYPVEEKSFRRPERPYRSQYFRAPVKYLQGGYRLERPFK